MRLADDLRGLRVLDIGTSDGFFALQLARRGAEVIAIDYRGKQDHGYYVMEQLNPVQIEYHRMNVYELADKHLGQFDLVLFLGVLYHLPDMIRALHLIRQCCCDMLFVETHSENDFCRDIAAARYFSGSSLANDHTNFWARATRAADDAATCAPTAMRRIRPPLRHGSLVPREARAACPGFEFLHHDVESVLPGPRKPPCATNAGGGWCV
jgi:hypothetical protein